LYYLEICFREINFENFVHKRNCKSYRNLSKITKSYRNIWLVSFFNRTLINFIDVSILFVASPCDKKFGWSSASYFCVNRKRIVINSLPQVMSVEARSIVSQIARIIAWPSSMAKQLARFLWWCGVTYRKSSIRPCMKLWKLLCLVIEDSGSSAMLPNTWDPQKKEGPRPKGTSGITNLRWPSECVCVRVRVCVCVCVFVFF